MKEYKLSYKAKNWFIRTDNDHIGKSLANNKPYEFEMLRYITEKYRGCYVDVGAHQGNHPIFIEMFGDFDVHAFEAIPSNYDILRENVGINGVDINTYPYALSDKAGYLAFAILKTKGSLNWQALNNGAYTVVDKTDNAKNIVQARTLDSFDLPVTVLKVDVEGHELAVLKGAENTIKKRRPVIFVEEDTIHDLTGVHKFLKGLGYQQGKRFNATPTFEWKYKK